MKLVNKIFALMNNLLGINTRIIARNSSYMTASRLVSAGLGFLTLTAFTRLSKPEIYGKFAFLVTIFEISAIFTLPGLTNALIQSVAKKYEGNLELISRVRFKYGLIGSLVLISGSIYSYIALHDLVVFYGLLVSAVILPFYYKYMNYEAFYIGRSDFFTFMVNTSILNALTSIIIILILFAKTSALEIFIVKIVVSSIIMAVMYYRTLKKAGKAVDGGVVDYGKKLTFLNLIGILQGRAEILIIPIFFTYADLAYYYVAQRVAGEYKNIWSTISGQMMPKLAAKTPENAFCFIQTKFKYILVFFSIVTLFLLLCVPFAFNLFFTSTYKASINLAMGLLIVSFAGITGAYYETYMISQKLTSKLSILRIIYPVTYFAALPLMTWKFGIWGLILSRGFSNIVYSLAGMFMVAGNWQRKGSSK